MPRPIFTCSECLRSYEVAFGPGKDVTLIPALADAGLPMACCMDQFARWQDKGRAAAKAMADTILNIAVEKALTDYANDGTRKLADLQAAMKGVDPWPAYKYNRDNEGNAPVTTSPERVDAILEEVLDRCTDLTSCFNDLWDAHKRLKKRYVKLKGRMRMAEEDLNRLFGMVSELENDRNMQRDEIAMLERRRAQDEVRLSALEESNTCILASVEELTKRVNVPVVRPECVEDVQVSHT